MEKLTNTKQNSPRVLVVGGGLAGAAVSLHLANNGVGVILAMPKMAEETNSYHAQGGIAAVLKHTDDSIEHHLQDTLTAGAGLTDEHVARFVIENAAKEIEQLETWGVRFDAEKDKSYSLHREGGHSASRILHIKDYTGKGIMTALYEKVLRHDAIDIWKGWRAVELLKNEHGNCEGALLFNGEEEREVRATQTILATGGMGALYASTSNPDLAWGSGVALAMEIGAEVKDMAFFQFHPTVLYSEESGKSLLISEAVRGAGGILRNHEGYAFMNDYDNRGDLATRDVVSKAIHREMFKSEKAWMYLDVTHFQKGQFKKLFPVIYKELIARGINPNEELIPVTPASHYHCGGIETDLVGRTNVSGLWAIGECARTGLHGANRLASNSLLEAIVFARSVSDALSQVSVAPIQVRAYAKRKAPLTEKYSAQIEAHKLEVSKYLGVERDREELKLQWERWRIQELQCRDSDMDGQKELQRRLMLSIAIAEDSLRHPASVGSLSWRREE